MEAPKTWGQVPGAWLLNRDPDEPIPEAEAKALKETWEAAEAAKVSQSRRRSQYQSTGQRHQSLDDWLRVLPSLKQRGQEFVGPCPVCNDGEDRFSVAEGDGGKVLFYCRECIDRRGMAQDVFFRSLVQTFFPREQTMKPLPAKQPTGPVSIAEVSLDEFIFITTNTSQQFFNKKLGVEMNAAGARVRAGLSSEEFKMAVGARRFGGVAEGIGSFPGQTDLIVKQGNADFVNTWKRPNHTPREQVEARIMEMGEVWTAHLQFLFPVQQECSLMLGWLAHTVQHPGERINWAPYVYSPVKGGGKTLALNALPSRLLGPDNIKVIGTAEVVGQEWTEWKSGAELCVIEDLEVPARFKAKVATKFLDAIGNERVSMLLRHKGGVPAPNFQNYILITNQPDIFPLDETERRWFYPRVCTTYREPAYYERLFKLLEDPDAIAATYYWLNDLPIPDEMMRVFKGRAPDTEFKAELLSTASGSIVADQITEIIEDESVVHVNEWYIGMHELRQAMKSRDWKPGKPYATLKRMGFDKYPKHKKIDGQSQDIYIRDLEMTVAAFMQPGNITREAAYKLAWDATPNPETDPSDWVENEVENQGGKSETPQGQLNRLIQDDNIKVENRGSLQ